MSKYNLIILSTTILILVLVSLSTRAETIDLKKVESYLALPERISIKIVNSLIGVLASEWIEINSSADFSASDQAVVALVKQGIEVKVWQSIFSRMSRNIFTSIYKVTLLISVPDPTSFALKELENLTVDLVKDKTTEYLLQEQTRVSVGEIISTYTNHEDQKVTKTFPYVLIYNQSKEKNNAAISFYSPDYIASPVLRGSTGLSGLWQEGPGEDINPFILTIKGTMNELEMNIPQWQGDPEIIIEYPDSVPRFNFEEENTSWKHKILQKAKERLEIVKNLGELFSGSSDLFKDIFGKKELFSSSIVPLTQELSIEQEVVTTQEEILSPTTSDAPQTQPTPQPTIIEPVLPTQNIESELELQEQPQEEIIIEETTEPQIIICSNRDDSPDQNSIIINEIAWMGTQTSASDEWMELKNISGQSVNLQGWQLIDKKNQIEIIFDDISIASDSFLLLERTDESTLPDIASDLTYTGNLGNSNETLHLFDDQCNLQDGITSWIEGDNSTKRTIERDASLSWQTSLDPGGTPRQANSSGYVSSSSITQGSTSDSQPEVTSYSEPTYSQSSSGGQEYCKIGTAINPTHAPVIINEIAWMGTQASASDEWIELKNISNSSADIGSWQLLNEDMSMAVVFSSHNLEPGGYLLLERTDDTTIPHIPYDQSYTGGLKNTDEALYLFDSSCQLIDMVAANPDWTAGENESKRTMERDASLSWHTYQRDGDNEIWGTPRSENSSLSSFSISPTVLSIDLVQGETYTQNISVTNSNQDSFGWVLSSQQTWITYPSSGTVPSNSTSQIEVLVDSATLEEGISTATFSLEEPNGTHTIEISINVTIPEVPTGHIIINEIAWMGTRASYNDEWIELKNTTSENVSIDGWTLKNADEGINISLSGTVPAGGFYLLERTDDTTIIDIATSLMDEGGSRIGYTGSLGNDGETLELRDDQGNLIDKVDCSSGWFAGDNETKISMERLSSTEEGSNSSNWSNNNTLVTNGKDAEYTNILGTPYQENSIFVTPTSINDLETQDHSTDTTAGVKLVWTAPRDGDSSTEDLYYEIKYRIGAEIDSDNWSSSAELTNALAVDTYQEAQSIEIWPLDYNQTYSFGIKTCDNQYCSPISNTVSFSTGDNPEEIWWGQMNGDAQKTGYRNVQTPTEFSAETLYDDWRIPISIAIGAHDFIYFVAGDNIYSLDNNYDLRWIYEDLSESNLFSISVVDNGSILALSTKMMMLDQLGNLIWEVQLSSRYDYQIHPAIYQDKIYLLNRCGLEGEYVYLSLFKFNLAGEVEWVFDTNNESTTSGDSFDLTCEPLSYSNKYDSAPSVSHNGDIYFADQYNFFALSSSGEFLWKKPLSGTSMSASTAMIDSQNRIYYFDGQYIQVLDSDGNQIYSYDRGRLAIKAPALGPDNIYVLLQETASYLATLPKDLEGTTISKVGSSPKVLLATQNGVYLGMDYLLYYLPYDVEPTQDNMTMYYNPFAERRDIYDIIPMRDGSLILISNNVYRIPNEPVENPFVPTLN